MFRSGCVWSYPFLCPECFFRISRLGDLVLGSDLDSVSDVATSVTVFRGRARPALARVCAPGCTAGRGTPAGKRSALMRSPHPVGQQAVPFPLREKSLQRELEVLEAGRAQAGPMCRRGLGHTEQRHDCSQEKASMVAGLIESFEIAVCGLLYKGERKKERYGRLKRAVSQEARVFGGREVPWSCSDPADAQREPGCGMPSRDSHPAGRRDN